MLILELLYARWGFLVLLLWMPAIAVAMAFNFPSNVRDVLSGIVMFILWGFACILVGAVVDRPKWNAERQVFEKRKPSRLCFLSLRIWGVVFISLAGLALIGGWDEIAPEFEQRSADASATGSFSSPGPQAPTSQSSPAPATVSAQQNEAVTQTASRGVPRPPMVFDCTKKSLGVDYVICGGDPELIEAEAELEEAYRAALQAPDGNPKDVKSSQRSWNRRYGPDCGLPAKGRPSDILASAKRDCVLTAINNRIAALNDYAQAARQDTDGGRTAAASPSGSQTAQDTIQPASDHVDNRSRAADCASRYDSCGYGCKTQSDTTDFLGAMGGSPGWATFGRIVTDTPGCFQDCQRSYQRCIAN